MRITLICSECGKEYIRQTYSRLGYTLSSDKKYWRSKEGEVYGLCEKCYKEKKENEKIKKAKEAKEISKEYELPELSGTERQVNWAIQIRLEILSKLNEHKEKLEEKAKIYSFNNVLKLYKDKKYEDFIDWFMINKTKASFYIENRDFFVKIDDVVKEFYDGIEKKDNNYKDVIEESIVYPQNAITNAYVKITAEKNKIKALFEKNNIFIEVVKRLGYKWKEVWEKEISEINGTIEDRMAELGSVLLNKGFPILILDENIRNKAINADYENEHKKWIHTLTGENNIKFRIRWYYNNQELFDLAKTLPGAKYENYGFTVNSKHFETIEEFARMYDFKFTEKAKQLLESEKEKFNNIEQIQPKKSKKKEEKNENALKAILESGDDVINDLKD